MFRLRKHADYQRVYRSGQKRFAKQMSYFFAARKISASDGDAVAPASGPRVGLTVGKVMGKAVDRNRIKRRLREAVRRNISLLPSQVDLILHPRKSVIDLQFDALVQEVEGVFRAVARGAGAESSQGQSASRMRHGHGRS